MYTRQSRNHGKGPAVRSIFFLLILSASLLLSATLSHSATVTLAWNRSTEPTLAGYKLYHGLATRNYSATVPVEHDPSSTSTNVTHTLDSVQDGETHFFAVTALDTSGNESDFSQELVCHTIVPISGAGGSISPAETAVVASGSSKTFTVTPGQGYEIENVLIDGVSVGAQSTYTFQSVSSNHTISASFKTGTPITYNIVATAGANGSITPSGSVPVQSGLSKIFSISSNQGYEIEKVLVDGVSVGAPSSYTFQSVSSDHTISASFKPSSYTITATAGANGSITPSGSVSVFNGSSKAFTITPNQGYEIEKVLVDGVSVGAPSSYNFQSVSSNHAISASFKAINYAITATAGANGAITPSGSVPVSYGSSKAFTITPGQGYEIEKVLVDGASVGAPSSYTFQSVSSNHTISASFTQSLKPPVADAGPDQEAKAGDTVTLNASNSFDLEGAITSYLWTQTAGIAVSLSNAASALATFTAPDVSESGEVLAFSLTVEDSSGLEATDTCLVNVTHVNKPPVANAGPDQTVTEQTLVTLDATRSSDPDDGIVTYSWVQIAGPTVDLPNPAAAKPTFTAPDVSDNGVALAFQLTATDKGGLQSMDSCTVNVSWVNSPPQAHVGPDQAVFPGETVVLDGSASTDPDDGIALHRWTHTGGTPAVALSDPTDPQPYFTAPEAGDVGGALIFSLTVTDHGGLTSTETSTVTVQPKPGPDLAGSWISTYFSRTTFKGVFGVKNVGSQNAGTFAVTLYRSSDGVSLTKLSSYTVRSLGAGQTHQKSLKYTLAKGSYLIAVIDSGNRVAETNETNNRVVIRVQ